MFVGSRDDRASQTRDHNGDVHAQRSWRRPYRALLATALVAMLALPAMSQTKPGRDPVTGTWLTHTGSLEVEIAPCGEALCGTVVKVIANRSMSGPGEMKPVDAKPVLGMKILIDFKSSDGGEWSGQIYNREDGKTYSCNIKLEAANQLVLRSYVGLPLFGKTLVWTRVVSENKAATGP